MTFKSGPVLVTGAGGSLGKEICAHLSSAEIPIRPIYRTNPAGEVPEEHLVCDLKNIGQNFPGNGVKMLVHCAAEIPGKNYTADDCYSINKIIDSNIAEIVEYYKIPNLVYFSSTSVYGFDAATKTEQSDLHPANLYSKGKIESEVLFSQLSNTNFISLRINAPYIPLQRVESILKRFISRAMNNEDLLYFGTGSRKQDFTHINDIARLINTIAKNGIKYRNETYNVSGKSPITMKELATLIVSLVPNCKSKVVAAGIPDDQESYTADFDIQKIKSHYNWFPKIELRDGISEWIKLLSK